MIKCGHVKNSKRGLGKSAVWLLLLCPVFFSGTKAVAETDTCFSRWQSLSDQYRAEQISMDAFLEEWKTLEPECAGTGEYELNKVRLLSGAGHFEQAADLAKSASLLPDVRQSLKLNLFFAYLDNSYYLPGKAHAVTDRDFWLHARDQYQDLLAISSGNETLAWRLTEISYLAGADRQAYVMATDFLSSQPSADYAHQVRQLLIRLCARTGRNGEAVFHFRQLQEHAPMLADQPDLLLTTAISAARSGQYPLAERLSRHISENHPAWQDHSDHVQLRQLLQQR